MSLTNLRLKSVFVKIRRLMIRDFAALAALPLSSPSLTLLQSLNWLLEQDMPNVCEEGAIEKLESVSAISSLVISGPPDISRLCTAKYLSHLKSYFEQPRMTPSVFYRLPAQLSQAESDNSR